MQISIEKTAELDYVLVLDGFASIVLNDGTRIELSSDLMRAIANGALECVEYFSKKVGK